MIPDTVAHHAARVLAWNKPSACPAKCRPGEDCPLGAAHGQPHQLAPSGKPWGPELFIQNAGRAAGKTRAAAEWVSTMLLGYQSPAGIERHPIILVGPTHRDVKRVMLTGPSGILSVLPEGIVTDFNQSDLVVDTIYGTKIMGFATSAIERVRGSEGGTCWWDEAAFSDGANLSPDHPSSPFSTVRNALRMGPVHRIRMTSTPRPVPLLRELMKRPGTVVRTSSTLENLYLPTSFRAGAEAAIASGSPLGMQEFAGHLIDAIEGARWSGQLLSLCRLDVMDDEAELARGLTELTVAVDPNAVGGDGRDSVGILTGGKRPDGRVLVLADDSGFQKAEVWPITVAGVVARTGARRVVIETDQGGSMPRLLISNALKEMGASRGVKIIDRRASKRGRDDLTRGQSHSAKWARAIMTAGYYGSVGGTDDHPALIGGQVLQLAGLTELEAEQTTYTHDSKWSPGRLDSLALLLRELLGKPGVGGVSVHAPEWGTGNTSSPLAVKL